MRVHWWLASVGMLVLSGAPSRQPSDVFAFFRPCVVVTAADVARLDKGMPVVRTLDEDDGNVAAFGARRVSIDGDRLLAWIREIAQLKQSRLVEAIGRFSDPPALTDVRGIRLDSRDQQELRECRAGNCGLKLTEAEIERLRAGIDQAGSDWRSRADERFRQLVLTRVEAYRTDGHGPLGRYADGHSTASLADVAASLMRRSPCLAQGLPAVVTYLSSPSSAPPASVDAFLYWSNERIAGRPVLSVTHVAAARGTATHDTATVVVGRQVFATHYFNGSLNITAVVGGASGGPRYLVVLNRSNVDVLQGWLGGLARWSVERRLRSELSGILDQLAARLESGPPPGGKYSAEVGGPPPS